MTTAPPRIAPRIAPPPGHYARAQQPPEPDGDEARTSAPYAFDGHTLIACAECQELAELWLAGVGYKPRFYDLIDHLRACPLCRAVYAAQQAMVEQGKE